MCGNEKHQQIICSSVVYSTLSPAYLSKALYWGKMALLYSTHCPSDGSSVSVGVTLLLENRLKEENLRTDTCWTSELSSCFCFRTCIVRDTSICLTWQPHYITHNIYAYLTNKLSAWRKFTETSSPVAEDPIVPGPQRFHSESRDFGDYSHAFLSQLTGDLYIYSCQSNLLDLIRFHAENNVSQ